MLDDTTKAIGKLSALRRLIERQKAEDCERKASDEEARIEDLDQSDSALYAEEVEAAEAAEAKIGARDVETADNLPNGAVVLLSSAIVPGDKEISTHQFLLCTFEGDYVTWLWDCLVGAHTSGNYFPGLDDEGALLDALADFRKRANI